MVTCREGACVPARACRPHVPMRRQRLDADATSSPTRCDAIPSTLPTSLPRRSFLSRVLRPRSTNAPTPFPTYAPTPLPSSSPTAAPSYMPSAMPSSWPTPLPSVSPTATPTLLPIFPPSPVPTPGPTGERIIVALSVTLDGIACADFGADEESALVAALATTLADFGVDEDSFSSTCTWSRRPAAAVLERDVATTVSVDSAAG